MVFKKRILALSTGTGRPLKAAEAPLNRGSHQRGLSRVVRLSRHRSGECCAELPLMPEERRPPPLARTSRNGATGSGTPLSA